MIRLTSSKNLFNQWSKIEGKLSGRSQAYRVQALAWQCDQESRTEETKLTTQSFFRIKQNPSTLEGLFSQRSGSPALFKTSLFLLLLPG